MTTYDPEIWLESTTRVLKSYVEDTINAPNVYNVVMEFPGAQIDAKELSLDKAIIHFALDDVNERPLGFGDRPVLDNYDAASHTVNPQYANIHTLNFDVGIWSSDRSGGTTTRMRARQWLTRLFSLPEGAERLRLYSDGGDGYIEILSMTGGRFAVEVVNDVRLYRMIDCTLLVRVFSRTPAADVVPITAIDEIDQAPGLTIIG